MNKFLETPVLFITYNRLDSTVKKSFAQIRKVKPKKLYLASDGPKKTQKDDSGKVEAVRAWLNQAVDWECEVKTRFSEVNQGCKYGVPNAIDWIFEQEESAIILEDDIVADESFFWFCMEMLEKYKKDERVFMVSGYKKVYDMKIEGDYFFSNLSSIWGWATWKRAWKYFDISMAEWPLYKKKRLLHNVFGNAAEFCLTEEFDFVYNGKLDAWDYPWLFANLLNSGLGIIPGKNLIENVGFDCEEATHTHGNAPEFQMETLKFPIRYEEHVVKNWDYDREYAKRSFKVKKIRSALRKYIPKALLNKWYRIRGVKI